MMLWHGLGEIYRTRLKDPSAAIAAFEVALGLDPDSIERRRALAELYRLVGPAAYAKAVGEHRAILARAKSPAEMEPDLKIARAPVRRDGNARRSARRGGGAGAHRSGRRRRAGALPAVPSDRRRPRPRAPDRGGLAETDLSPRAGPGAVADPGDALARGRHGAGAAIQGYRPQEEAAARCRLRHLDAVQGARLRRRGARRARRPRSTWRPKSPARSTSSTCAARWRGAVAAHVAARQGDGRDALGRRAGVRGRADAGGAAPRSSAALAELRADAGGAGHRRSRGASGW